MSDERLVIRDQRSSISDQSEIGNQQSAIRDQRSRSAIHDLLLIGVEFPTF